MKHNFTETVMPYLLLVPPTTQRATSVIPPEAGLSTKQFYLPFASDPHLSVLQLSRNSRPLGLAPDATVLGNYCSSNSPLCLGMVFYSITFFRI
jgi:hypothetical protein